jgi:hypothetical protein
VSRSLFRRSSTITVAIWDAGSTAELSDVVVLDTRVPHRQTAGLVTGLGATTTLRRVLFARNGTSSVLAQNAGTTLRAEDVVVRNPIPDPATGELGRGIDVLDGAELTADRLLIENTHEIGLFVGMPGSMATLRDLTIRGVIERECAATTCPDRGLGCGVSSVLQATTRIERFVIADNALCGIQLARDGVADLIDGEIADNLIGANIQTTGFDVQRISDGVIFRDNGRNIDMATLAEPEIVEF